MKLIMLLAIAAFGGLLMYASTTLPLRGDVDSPAHRDSSSSSSPVASSYYIRNAMRDAQTPNIVTAVLADYRSYDTLGETLVVLTAGFCCSLIMRKRKS